MTIDLLIFVVILIIIIIWQLILVLFTPGGKLSGLTKDETGAILPNVNLTLKGDGVDLAAASGEDGAYAFPKVTPGTYHLTAQKDMDGGAYYFAEMDVEIGTADKTLDVTLAKSIA